MNQPERRNDASDGCPKCVAALKSFDWGVRVWECGRIYNYMTGGESKPCRDNLSEER